MAYVEGGAGNLVGALVGGEVDGQGCGLHEEGGALPAHAMIHIPSVHSEKDTGLLNTYWQPSKAPLSYFPNPFSISSHLSLQPVVVQKPPRCVLCPCPWYPR